MKDNRTIKELFNDTNSMAAIHGEDSYQHTVALAYFTQGYGRGVLDTIQQRREIEEGNK